jgi:excisionase family DNA binding protein
MGDLKDELLTVAEAAALLKVTPHTVYRWIAEGRMPARRFSRRVLRVRREDAEGVGPSSGGAIGESRVDYAAGSERAHPERDANKRTPTAKPRPGSREALLKLVGSITYEEAEELRRVIREAKTYSPPIEL